jgi:hypothetical protein
MSAHGPLLPSAELGSGFEDESSDMLRCETRIVPKRIHRERAMFQRPSSRSRGLPGVAAAAFGLVLAVLGGVALAQQDKYALQVPNGLAFSEFRGYEAWQVVSISHDGPLLAAILANPVMQAFPGWRQDGEDPLEP